MKWNLLVLLLAGVAFSAWGAREDTNLVRTPTFSIRVPKGHVALVAIDRGEPGNRKFLNQRDAPNAKGVEPISGWKARVTNELHIFLIYPEKQEDPLRAPQWQLSVMRLWSNTAPPPEGMPNIISGALGEVSTFPVATREQEMRYQHEGALHFESQLNLLETPVEPTLEEVPTGVPGTKLYQIPYCEVEGLRRSVVVLVSEDLERARQVLKVEEGPNGFSWRPDWFHADTSW
jgi:hypothetical protein